MKPEEAIVWIEDTRYIYENMNPNIELSKLKCEAFNLAIQALEKQVPKLAIWDGPYNDAKDDAETYCPNNECNYELDADDWSFCPKCGTSVVFHQDEVQK